MVDLIAQTAIYFQKRVLRKGDRFSVASEPDARWFVRSGRATRVPSTQQPPSYQTRHMQAERLNAARPIEPARRDAPPAEPPPPPAPQPPDAPHALEDMTRRELYDLAAAEGIDEVGASDLKAVMIEKITKARAER